MPLRNPVGGVKAPRTRYLGHVRDLAIYLVDGERVRNELDIDFTCGGNEAVYPNYVPKGEIWIDDALSALDRTATLLHEIVERDLMIEKRWSYDRAHDAASARERPFRKALRKQPPRSIDLERVAKELATGTSARPVKHEREEPPARAAGRRRKTYLIKRDIQALVDAWKPVLRGRG